MWCFHTVCLLVKQHSASCSCFKKPEVGDSLELVPAAVEQEVMRPQLDAAGSDGGGHPQPTPLPPSYPHHLLSAAGPPRPSLLLPHQHQVFSFRVGPSAATGAPMERLLRFI